MLSRMALLEAYRRDDWTFVYEAAVDGEPSDLTGVHLFFTLKRNPTDADESALVQHDYVVPVGDLARNGLAIMVVPHDKTDVVPGCYFFDIQQILPGADAITNTTFGGGEKKQFRVLQDVTQRRA